MTPTGSFCSKTIIAPATDIDGDRQHPHVLWPALKSPGPWMAWKLAIKRTKYGREMYRHISYLWRLFRSSISRAINSRQQTVPLVTAKSIFDPRSSWTYLLVFCGHILQHVTPISVKLIKIISMAMVSRCWLMEAGGGSTAGLSAAQFKK